MLLLFFLILASSCSASSFSEDLDALNTAIGNGEYKKGLSGALIIAEKAQAANDTAALGKAYLLISDAHYYLGNADLYQSYVEKALKAFLRINDASGIGQSYYNLAYCYERIDPIKMLRLLEEALPYSKKSKNFKLQMNIENAMGTTLWHLGRFLDSIPHLEESGKIADQLNEGSYKGTVLQNLALDYEYLADYDRALKLYKEALAIAEKTGRISLQATVLGNTGNVLNTLGDSEQALICFRKARALHNKTGYRRGELTQMVNVASLHTQLGEWNVSLSTLEEALKMAREIDDQRGQVEIISRIAYNKKQNGDLTTAEKLLQQALEGAKRNGDPSLFHQIKYEQAELNELDGQFEEALANAEAAANYAATSADVYRQALCVALQARIHAARGENNISAEMYRKASDLHESIRALQFLPQWYGALAKLEPQNAEQYYKKSLEKIRQLDSLLTIDRFRIQLFAQVSSIYHAYAGWLASRGRLAEGWKILEDGRNQGLKLRLVQAQATAITTKERELLARINRLQRQLREESLLRTERQRLMHEIAVIETDYEDARAEAIKKELSSGIRTATIPLITERLAFQYAFVDNDILVFSSHRGKFQFRRIENSAAVNNSVLALHQQLSVGQSAEQLLSKLGNTLMGPELKSSSKPEILVIPDQILYLVPFSALKRNGRYLVEDYTISIAPSLAAAMDKRATKLKKSALLIAQSNFQDMKSSPFPLPNIPGVLKEANDLSRYGNGSIALVNQSETRIKNMDFGKHDLIHFATHTLIDEARPERSSIVVSPDRDNDGFLQAREIYRMSIPVQTVILSSCSSGRGKFSAGEGILGLSHALLSAGARSLVLSLWDVSDDGSAEFMRILYEEMSDKPLSEVFRQAQLRMMTSRRWKNPSAWSAFVVQGNADVQLALHKPRTSWKYFFAAFVFAFLILALFRFIHLPHKR